MTPSETLAKLFHDTYEGLAPLYGYETRKDTREFDPHSANGKLMTVVCDRICRTIRERTLEEAAKACEDNVRTWSHPGSITRDECAAVIRSLIGNTVNVNEGRL